MVVQGYHSLMNRFLFDVSDYAKAYYGSTNSNMFNTITSSQTNQSVWDGVLMNTVSLDNTHSYSIQVGTGTTPPKFSDYCLKTMLRDTKLLFGAHSSYISMKDGVMDRHISRMFTNITKETIVVSEIGLFVGPYMIAREVLEQPVAIPPAGSATFKVQIY